ncbi:MAG: DUF4360 domain-containing protein [Nostoc sp. NOS(2021)]|uniref:DUF4360 domain-containing protein n=1 Tax=Nostoc sp. NOS(2021) TaxID=2815407 RepID=UPI0025EE3C16|nr:DUF4360 domain-containing protein [Nostoc sp. NOS(2021)]MBN3896405.1 DUF4360 domain-containing protein [Nostoc sp. NOS(2021)]
MKVLSTLVSSLTLLSLNVVGLSQVHAQPQGFQFQQVPVTVFGNGCPSGNAQTNLKADTLFVTLPQFQAVAVSPNVVSKSCNLRIGLNVPKGYKVKPINIKYVGFANVPKGGSADLKVTLVFQGKNVPNSSNDPNANFPSGFSNGWVKNVAITPDAIDACANPVNSVFGINTNLIARARDVAARQQTKILIAQGYQIKFTFTRC